VTSSYTHVWESWLDSDWPSSHFWLTGSRNKELLSTTSLEDWNRSNLRRVVLNPCSEHQAADPQAANETSTAPTPSTLNL